MSYYRLFATFLFTALLTACSSADRKSAESPGDGYDTEENCLNGTMVVSKDGKYGLADTTGGEILPTDYDDVYFLTDELAVAFDGRLCLFIGKDGRRLGEAFAEPGSSPETLLRDYSRMERIRREQWDSILWLYGELRRYCQSDSATAETAALMAEEIKAEVRKVSGPMEKDQKARFESEYLTYATDKMRRHCTLIFIAFIYCFSSVSAQNAADIRRDAAYIYAEATARSTMSADSLALAEMAEKLVQTVSFPYPESTSRNLMMTYSNDIKRECGMISSNGRKSASVLRYIRRDEVERIFSARKNKIDEMTAIARTADKKNQTDEALRYYSWAETLMRSLPSPDVVRIAEMKSRKEAILNGLKAEFDRQDIYNKGVVELTLTCNGKPVKNIDYRFYDGKAWSGVLSAKDGKGFVEVRPDSKIDQYRVKYEITPSHLRHLFREVNGVEKAFAERGQQGDTGLKSGKADVAASGLLTPDAAGNKQDLPTIETESSARKIDFSAVKRKVLEVVARDEFQTIPDSSRGGI